MTTATAPKSTETDSTVMTFEELTAELQAVQTQKQHAVATSDLAGILRLKDRERVMTEQLARIRISDLQADVAMADHVYQEALTVQKTVAEESAEAMATARADIGQATGALDDAKRRHYAAIQRRDGADHTVKQAQLRVSVARRMLTDAMQALAER